MGEIDNKVLRFAREGIPPHPSLDDLVPEVRPYLEAALAGLKSRTEDIPGTGVRLFLGEGELVFSGWTSADLRGCLEDTRPEAEAWREVVRTLAFLLKVREDLSSYRSRTAGSDDPGPAFVPMFERDLDLFADAFARIEETIDAAVLRGELVGARNLSRFRDLLLPYRLQSRLALEEVRQESQEFRRKLKAREDAAAAQVRQAMKPAERKVRSPRRGLAAPKEESQFARLPTPLLDPQARTVRFPFLFMVFLMLAVTRWGVGIYDDAVANQEPSFTAGEVARILPHNGVFPAGGVLYATVGGEWDELDHRARLGRFQRLCETAEDRGFAGVVLLDEQGDFAARWSRGRIPAVWNR